MVRPQRGVVGQPWASGVIRWPIDVGDPGRSVDQHGIGAREVIVELPGTYRPVQGTSVRSTTEHGTQLVVLAEPAVATSIRTLPRSSTFSI